MDLVMLHSQESMSLLVRHHCPICSVVFNPDGSRQKLTSIDDAKRMVDGWHNDACSMSELYAEVIARAEEVLEDGSVD